jgi:hypothetical protein
VQDFSAVAMGVKKELFPTNYNDMAGCNSVLRAEAVWREQVNDALIRTAT